MSITPLNAKLALCDLEPSDLNPNEMSSEYIDKLAAHIDRTGNYPPLIVRCHPSDPGRYQIIDGHQRKKALSRINHQQAWCQIWNVDDVELMMLLSTLNRLEGQDDYQRRGNLLSQLAQEFEISQLAEQLPLDAAAIRKYIEASQDPPKPQAPEKRENMVTALTIFVTEKQRNAILLKLAEIDKDRGRALITALQMAEAYRGQVNETPTRNSPGPASEPAD